MKGNRGSVSARSSAIEVLQCVIDKGQSMSEARSRFDRLEDPRDRGLAMELTNGVLRRRWSLLSIVGHYLKKPFKKKDNDVLYTLLIACYEILELEVPEYASVDEAVRLVKKSRKAWAQGLVNAVLRNIIRARDADDLPAPDDEEARYSHPRWIIDRLRDDWPDHWQTILEANDQRPAIWLRVNRLKTTTEDYLTSLRDTGLEARQHDALPAALRLEERLDITGLPGFDGGMFSVQDAGAQFAAKILSPQVGERILDLCAAPGGKTAHLKELSPNSEVLAVDDVAARLERVKENLARLGLQAKVQQGDAAEPDGWWDGELFDAILLDAPCSASGVIRRHPDIKSLRREDDIAVLSDLQARILDAAWTMLRPGGRLLYVTCSVFRQENSDQIQAFLSRHEEANLIPLSLPASFDTGHGMQLFPGEDMDGFFYAFIGRSAG